MDVQWRTRWHPVERKHDIMKEFRRTLKMDLPRPYRAREQQGQCQMWKAGLFGHKKSPCVGAEEGTTKTI